jgi:endonuclease III
MDDLPVRSSARLIETQVREVARVLTACYRDHDLHNRRNPLEELLFIICSTLTHEKNYRATFRHLKTAFPTARSLSDASVDDLALALRWGGLSRRKAIAIRAILDRLSADFGRVTLAPIRSLSDRDCEDFLSSLPLVGPKTARCVMLFSLDRAVFPVDTHCWRIARRLGWVEPTRRDGSCGPRDMDILQDLVPRELRRSLHVNLISFGRTVCRAQDPACSRCPVETLCPKVGVPQRSTSDALASLTGHGTT